MKPSDVQIRPNLFDPSAYDLFVYATRMIFGETMTVCDNVREALLWNNGGITETRENADSIRRKLSTNNS